ncbi:MAG: preprotein translocase subunit YajC [Chitinophagaceae bacterium]|nr:preprotein translocase subunit YajC [Chitinophagaceae bacterium]MBP9103637.1 preprotein translocase subunit YajC [Chitinophagaceae bacterium]
MKSRITYLSAITLLLFFSSCTPPGGDAGKSGGTGGTIQLVFLGLMILVFWMFFIRPQAKRAKNQKSFIENLGKGDKIVTIAGIHGTINKNNEDGTLNIEVSPGSYLKIEKSAISMDWTSALNKPLIDKK